jgi:hypothetical protein
VIVEYKVFELICLTFLHGDYLIALLPGAHTYNATPVRAILVRKTTNIIQVSNEECSRSNPTVFVVLSLLLFIEYE